MRAVKKFQLADQEVEVFNVEDSSSGDGVGKESNKSRSSRNLTLMFLSIARSRQKISSTRQPVRLRSNKSKNSSSKMSVGREPG